MAKRSYPFDKKDCSLPSNVAAVVREHCHSFLLIGTTPSGDYIFDIHYESEVECMAIREELRRQIIHADSWLSRTAEMDAEEHREVELDEADAEFDDEFDDDT